jgi:hypothetical protein
MRFWRSAREIRCFYREESKTVNLAFYQTPLARAYVTLAIHEDDAHDLAVILERAPKKTQAAKEVAR